jgi:hypothetical protein
MKRIGGFIALHLPGPVVEQSGAGLWGISYRKPICYSSGRSALAAPFNLPFDQPYHQGALALIVSALGWPK